MRRVGAHLSISGGMYKAIESVSQKGGNCLQIFSSSPRMWVSNLPLSEDVDRFKAMAKESDVKPVYIHAKYLVNMASDNMELIEKSRKSLEFDFKVGEMIGASGVIVHIGSHLGRGFEAVKDQVVGEIKKILKASPGSVKFLVENAAQKKGKIGFRLEEIRLLLEAVDSNRVGWCLDTCHAYNAGYSLGKGLGNTLLGFDIVEEVKKLKLVESLECLHVNDSRDLFDSGRDRHANLGEGEIGLKGLKAVLSEPVFSKLPLIIETPGFDNKGPDKKNLDILKSLI